MSFNLRSKLKTGIEVRPSFSISQQKRNLKILKEINQFFNCGSLRFSKRDQNYKFEVRNLQHLRSQIIPHFQTYVLLTTKKNDFQIFAEVCDVMSQSRHLNPKFLESIIIRSYQMNESGKRKYTKAKLLSVLRKMKI